MAKKNWIQNIGMKKGALHAQLGVSPGEKIPAEKMSSAAAGNYGPKAAKRANLAQTLGSFKEGGNVSETGPYKLHAGETVIPAKVAGAPAAKEEAEEAAEERIHPGIHKQVEEELTEPARCLNCDWSGKRVKEIGDGAACPDCGNGTTRHASPSARVDGRKDTTKMQQTMDEYKTGSLHSGSKQGPVVKSRAQAIAIGLNQARKAGQKV